MSLTEQSIQFIPKNAHDYYSKSQQIHLKNDSNFSEINDIIATKDLNIFVSKSKS